MQSQTSKIILSIVITAVVVGGGVYFWQNQKNPKEGNVAETWTATSTQLEPETWTATSTQQAKEDVLKKVGVSSSLLLDGKFISAYRITEFNREIDGISQWRMPQTIKDQLLASTNPCSVFEKLKNGSIKINARELYLPLDVDTSPVLCKRTAGEIGTQTISLVGVEYFYENLPFLGNMILVVKKDDVVVLSSLVPDSVTGTLNADLKKMKDDYIHAHPEVEFPNAAWKKMNTFIQMELANWIQMPKPELKDALDYLDTIGASITSVDPA